MPTGPGWLHEIKYDGYRILGRKAGDETTLFSRSGLDWTVRFPAIAPALAEARRAALLVFARWVLVMTNFERRLYADPDADLDTLWWDLVEQHQLVHRPDDRQAPDWAAKIHLAAAPVYYQNYLYGELFASQLDATLRDRAGGLVDRAAAGALLRDEVFAPGASLRWDALVERATGAPLTADAMARALTRSA